ncbi:MAG: FHA domain-containing protein [Lachnospiraceae bacterium]|nr:FHA domain-containing protein [Lachnospiraceae bacterium]
MLHEEDEKTQAPMPMPGGDFITLDKPQGYDVVLTDVSDPAKTFRAPIGNGVLIGRKASGGANIIINYDPSVSGTHCKITASGDSFFIEDLRSTNHTFVNGAEVTKTAPIKAGDQVKMGNAIFTLNFLPS